MPDVWHCCGRVCVCRGGGGAGGGWLVFFEVERERRAGGGGAGRGGGAARPAATAPAEKERSAHRLLTCLLQSNVCSQKFSNRCMTRLWRSANPTRMTRKPTRTSRKRLKPVSRFLIGAGTRSAKPKSRKKPAPPCGASR